MDRNTMKNIIFPGSLNKRIRSIQNNEEEIDPLIYEYKPFIMATVRKCTYKDSITEQDDELSIALIAFAEAVKAYREDKGNFLSFAKNIIRMRCIDFYRKEKRHTNNLPLLDGDGENEEGAESSSVSRLSITSYEQNETARIRALEIEQFKQELAEWNITLDDLVNVSPKQERTRRLCREAVDHLLGSSEKIQNIFQKKLIPLSDIEKETHIPRKQLERVRKYIIAILIIKKGDYPFLNEYVKDWGCSK